MGQSYDGTVVVVGIVRCGPNVWRYSAILTRSSHGESFPLCKSWSSKYCSLLLLNHPSTAGRRRDGRRGDRRPGETPLTDSGVSSIHLPYRP